MALAAATSKVRVNAGRDPFVVTPPNLANRAFNDPAVGLDRSGMAAFKGNLRSLLPGIADDVDAIPENPATRIGDVAKQVAQLLAASRLPGEIRTPAGAPTIITTNALHEAREQVKNAYGVQFAQKTTDSALLSLARSAMRPTGRARAMREGATALAGAGSLIIELTHEQPAGRPRRETGSTERALREAAKAVDRRTPDRRVGTPLILRQTQLSPTRDSFYKSVAPLYAEIGKRAGIRPGREAVSGRRTLDVCWLNRTIRTLAAPLALADIVGDRTIDCVDVPRRLVREMRLCGPLVGAPLFRTRTGRDGAGIVVAVIDGEVDVTHQALATRVMQKRNMTREPFGFPDGHGTAVAGIIGAQHARFSGIAPAVSILNYKVFATDPLLDSEDFDGALAIQQALEDGAHIANISWGAGAARDGSSRLARACDQAWNLGMIIVKSAGNDGPRSQTLTSPADAEGVIVVGATDRRGRDVQSYSSRGPAGARVRPHLVAPGGTDTSGIETCLPGGGFGNVGDGTSFAAPQISGLAALLLDDDPNLAPDAVRTSLIESCAKLPGGDDNTQGAGLVRVR
jgi:serine protease AprX